MCATPRTLWSLCLQCPGKPHFALGHADNPDKADVNSSLNLSEAYSTFDTAGSYVDVDASQHNSGSFNPYVHDPSTAGGSIYNQHSTFAQPVFSYSTFFVCFRT